MVEVIVRGLGAKIEVIEYNMYGSVDGYLLQDTDRFSKGDKVRLSPLNLHAITRKEHLPEWF